METDENLQEQRSARADLYLRHSPNAIRLAFLLTGDRELAADLVHDAFVRLFGRLLHLRNPDAFEAYLRQTVVNLCRMHFRHASGGPPELVVTDVLGASWQALPQP